METRLGLVGHTFCPITRLYRDLPWRRTRDPYLMWISEVMLQQTQVARVDGRWQRWLERFPDRGRAGRGRRGRRAGGVAGHGLQQARPRAAACGAGGGRTAGGRFPREARELVALPGIGPATAAGIRAFAYNLPGVYLETNVRTVFLHELYPGATSVPDRELVPLVEAACPPDAHDPADDPRTWYYALLDYGAHLKRTVPNPSRRSRSHVRQSRFEGSHRQKRAMVVRLLLAHRDGGAGRPTVACARARAQEVEGGRRRARRGSRCSRACRRGLLRGRSLAGIAGDSRGD